jgi:hypothetical protein
MRAFAVLVLVTATAQEPGSPAALELAVREGGVTIHARAVALKEILDRLANATGMKVVYDGAPPLSPVTISLENAPPPVAVLRLMEGLGLGYAFSHDAERSGVGTLLLFERKEGASPAPHVSEARPASRSEDALPLEDEGGGPTEPVDVDTSEPQIPDGVSLPSRPLIPEAVSFPSQPQIPAAISFPRR